MLLASLLRSVLGLAAPILIQYWKSAGIPIENEQLVQLILILITSLAVTVLMAYVREKYAKWYNIQNFLRYFRLFSGLDYRFLMKEGSEKLLNDIKMAVSESYAFLTGCAVHLLSAMISLSVILVLVGRYSIELMWLMIFYGCFSALNIYWMNKRLTKTGMAMQQVTGTEFQCVRSLMGEFDFVKQVSTPDTLVKCVEAPVEKVYSAVTNHNTATQVSLAFTNGINTLVHPLMLVFSVYSSFQQPFTENETMARLIMLTVVIPLFYSNLSTILNANSFWAQWKASQLFIKEWKKHQETQGKQALTQVDSISIQIPENRLEQQKLTEEEWSKREGGLDGDRLFSFSTGDVVWIKGESGSGKSTLVKSILRFWDHYPIQINQQPIENFTRSSLRKQIAYLSQKPVIINASLRTNLFLDIPYSEALEEKFLREPILKSILKTKNMDDIIAEEASNLSGGERQKIAFARLCQKNAPIIILDEITSGIDQETAKQIWQRVETLRKDHIIFIISHEEGPAAVANQIIYLKSPEPLNLDGDEKRGKGSGEAKTTQAERDAR